MSPPEPTDVIAAKDPLGSFAKAHREGRLVALNTSGTTGQSRRIVRTTSSWVDSFPHVSTLLGIDATSRVWIPGPLTSTMNLFAAVHAEWAGARRVDTPRVATHAHMLPSTLRRELDVGPEDLVGRHILVAGDRLERSTFDDATAHGIRVSHYYGAAELSFIAWGTHAESLRPFPGVEVVSRRGELWVRSPYVCERYLELDRMLRSDSGGWSTVGDRGDVVDGYVVVLGREGGITTGGATVMVADIEHALCGHAVGEVVVVGLPHPELGEVVVAVVTRSDDVPHLRALSRRRLTTPQQPRRWLQLDSLPLTGNGKLDRSALVTAISSIAPPQ